LARESPQLLALRAEEQNLTADFERRRAAMALVQDAETKAEYSKRQSSAPPSSDGSAQASRARELRPPAPVMSEPRDVIGGDTTTDYATLRFRLQLNQLQSVLDRIDGARIELAVSQAAFKYRYTVIRPARVPRAPVKPNMAAIIAAGVAGAFALALIATVGADLRSRRILQIWQVERQLDLPALGVIRNP
jgi:hypothetical protein